MKIVKLEKEKIKQYILKWSQWTRYDWNDRADACKESDFRLRKNRNGEEENRR